MKFKLIAIALILFCCGQKSDKAVMNAELNKLRSPVKILQRPDSGMNQKPSIVYDSTELQRFWDIAVIPILKKDKETVLNNMDFPVLGDWTRMMQMDIESETATRQDFDKIYDRFFSDDFREILSKQSSRNAGMFWFKDRVGYNFWVQDTLGMSGVSLVFYEDGDVFKLKLVQGAGGNFYGWEKPTQ